MKIRGKNKHLTFLVFDNPKEVVISALAALIISACSPTVSPVVNTESLPKPVTQVSLKSTPSSEQILTFGIKKVDKQVPYISQYQISALSPEQRKIACAPTTFSMLMAFLGKETNLNSTASKLFTEFKTNSGGTNRDNISPVLKKLYGIDSGYTSTDLVNKIDRMLSQGLPVPFRSYSIKKPNGFVFKDGHWLLITDKQGDTVTVNDPEAGVNLKYSLNQMMKSDPGIVYMENKKPVTYSYELLNTKPSVRTSTWNRPVIDAVASMNKSIATFRVTKTDFPWIVFKDTSKVMLKVGGNGSNNVTSKEITVSKLTSSVNIEFDVSTVAWPDKIKEYWIRVENKDGYAISGPYKVAIKVN